MTGATVLRRGPWTDAVEADGEILVLVGDQPMRLGGPGRASWLAVDEPRTLDELVAAVIEELGWHPDARALTLDAVEQLGGQGLIEQV